MRIYVVQAKEGTDSWIIGAYSSMELATNRIHAEDEKMERIGHNTAHFYIDEETLDDAV